MIIGLILRRTTDLKYLRHHSFLAVVDLLLVEKVNPLFPELLKQRGVGGVELVALNLRAVLHLGKEL